VQVKVNGYMELIWAMCIPGLCLGLANRTMRGRSNAKTVEWEEVSYKTVSLNGCRRLETGLFAKVNLGEAYGVRGAKRLALTESCRYFA
jgi:hypothetical protein